MKIFLLKMQTAPERTQRSLHVVTDELPRTPASEELMRIQARVQGSSSGRTKEV